MIKNLIVVLFLTTLYTLLRYVICGPVSPDNIPVFLLNKSLSMASVICLFLGSLMYFKNKVEFSRFWGKSAFHFAILHVLLSLSILNSAYYGKFFGSGKLNLFGELTLLFGVLGIYLFALFARNSFKPKPKIYFQILGGISVLAHLFFMGFKGWITIGKWHGHLPPISLISFVFCLGAIFLWVLRKSQAGQKI